MGMEPPKPIVIAYARKLSRLSAEVEKLARVARGWMPRGVIRDLWASESELFSLAKALNAYAKYGCGGGESVDEKEW